VNHRVGIVKFDIINDLNVFGYNNTISNELLLKILDKYDNLYDILINDCSN